VRYGGTPTPSPTPEIPAHPSRTAADFENAGAGAITLARGFPRLGRAAPFADGSRGPVPDRRLGTIVLRLLGGIDLAATALAAASGENWTLLDQQGSSSPAGFPAHDLEYFRPTKVFRSASTLRG
jgi:hypothetical protein